MIWIWYFFWGALSQLIEAQRSLRDSKAKLSNLRGHDESARNVTPSRKDSYPSPSPSKILKPSVPTSSISKSKTNTVVVKQKPETSSSRDGFSNSKTKTVVVKQKPETSSSRDSPNLKASRDRDKGTKRKFGKLFLTFYVRLFVSLTGKDLWEVPGTKLILNVVVSRTSWSEYFIAEHKEHKELIRFIARNSSPTTIKCHSSNQISSQHKRKLRSLILCPVNEQLFATRYSKTH